MYKISYHFENYKDISEKGCCVKLLSANDNEAKTLQCPFNQNKKHLYYTRKPFLWMMKILLFVGTSLRFVLFVALQSIRLFV